MEFCTVRIRRRRIVHDSVIDGHYCKAELDDTQASVEEESLQFITRRARVSSVLGSGHANRTAKPAKGSRREAVSFHILSPSTPNVIANWRKDLSQQGEMTPPIAGAALRRSSGTASNLSIS
jgi:hypothetical protein